MRSARTWLLVLAERKALAWVLNTGQMAFSERRAMLANELLPGDRLLLYSTRGCFHNPALDRGRVFGEAVVIAGPQRSDVEVAGSMFSLLMPIRIESLAPFRSGLELAPLVPRLKVFPDAGTWSARIRTPLLPLPSADVALIRKRLAPLLGEPESIAQEYFDRAIGARERNVTWTLAAH